MKQTPSSIGAMLFAAAMVIWFAPGAFAWSAFTNGADFTNAIATNNFTETFDGLPDNVPIPSPTDFSGGGFSFDAASANYNGEADSLYSIENLSVGSAVTVSYYDSDSLVFTNFSSGVTAIGGNFFASEINYLNFTSAPVTLTVLLANLQSVSTNITPATSTNFFGFVFDTDILSLTISANLAYYPTAGSLTVGFAKINTNTIVSIGDGKLFYSFVAPTTPKPFSDVVTTTNLMLSNSWTTNGVTVLPTFEVSPGLTRYQFETSITNDTRRFLRALPPL